MNEENVKRQVALLAVQWRELVGPDRFRLMVDRILAMRGFTDSDVEAAVLWTVDNIETCPTVATFIGTMRDQRRQRLDRTSTKDSRQDHGLPRVILTTRRCMREGCEGHPELILDVPEPGTRNRAHSRMWCPVCKCAQPIERDPLTGTLRYWLDPDEIDELTQEPHELAHYPTQGYHHMASWLAERKGEMPPPCPAGTASLRDIRQREHRRNSDLVSMGELLGNPGVTA